MHIAKLGERWVNNYFNDIFVSNRSFTAIYTVIMGKQYWHLRKLDLLFEFLGRTVVREPCKVMAFSVALSILLASGVVNLNMVSSSNELWIPRDSAEYKNIHRTDELFPSGGRGTLMFVLGAEKESNVLDEQHLVATFVVRCIFYCCDEHGIVSSRIVKRRGWWKKIRFVL